MTVTQCLMRTESGDVQSQRPAAADGVRTEGFQFCFGVGRQCIAWERVHPEKEALPFPLHAAENPAQAKRSGFQCKAMLPCIRPAFALQ